MTVFPNVEGAVDRRTLLRVAGLSAGASVIAAAALPGAATAAADELFRHGVASGDPLPGGILLWTRVTTGEPDVAVDWQIAADPSFIAVVQAGTQRTGPEHDHTVKVDIGGLAPATTYWYPFGGAGRGGPPRPTEAPPAPPGHNTPP